VRIALTPGEAAQAIGCSRDFFEEHTEPELRYVRPVVEVRCLAELDDRFRPERSADSWAGVQEAPARIGCSSIDGQLAFRSMIRMPDESGVGTGVASSKTEEESLVCWRLL
jgi:hypothetical protein